MEEDLVLEMPEDEGDRLMAIIDCQLVVLSTLDAFDVTLYDDAPEHKIRIATAACKLILKAQTKLFKEI
jgi:hypothetical protein